MTVVKQSVDIFDNKANVWQMRKIMGQPQS